MDNQRKKQIDPNLHLQRNHPKQLHNVPAFDVENTNSTNKGTDLFLANKPRIVPWGTKKLLQRIQRKRRATLHWSAHVQRSKTRRKNLGMVWTDNKKAFDMVPQTWVINCLKMHKISDEVINFIEKTMKTWGMVGKLNKNKDPKRHIPKRCTTTILLFIIAMMPRTTTYKENALPDTNLVNHRKRSIN